MRPTGDKVAPSKNDPPDPPEGHQSYAKALKKSRFKPKVQLTPILSTYLQMKSRAERRSDNMLELTFQKQDSGDTSTPEFPSLDVVANYLFEVLEIDPSDALEIDHFSNRSKKRILLRDGINIDQHRLYMPDTFKGYVINVEKPTQGKIKIIFKIIVLHIKEVQKYKNTHFGYCS